MEHSLDDICVFFEIPSINCTCSYKILLEAVKELNLCNFTVAYTIQEIHRSSDATLPYAVLALIIGTIGLIANGLVILVAFIKRKEISNCQKIIGCLAVSDFIFASVQIIVTVPRLWTHEWLYGNGLCKLLYSSMSLGGILSIGFIVTITIERYVGIMWPLNRLSTKRLFIIIGVNISLSIISLSPYFVYLEVNSHSICSVHWPNKVAPYIYESYMLIFATVLPVMVILVLYVRVIYVLKSLMNDKDLKESLTKKNHKRKVKETHKIMKVVMALVLAFLVFVTPNRIIRLYLHTEPSISSATYNVISCIALLTYPCHVTINPILYNMIDKKWRRSLNDLINCSHSRFYGNVKTTTVLKMSLISRKRSTRQSGNTSPVTV